MALAAKFVSWMAVQARPKRIAQAADYKGGEHDQQENQIVPGQVFTSLECADEGKSWTPNRMPASPPVS